MVEKTIIKTKEKIIISKQSCWQWQSEIKSKEEIIKKTTTKSRWDYLSNSLAIKGKEWQKLTKYKKKWIKNKKVSD